MDGSPGVSVGTEETPQGREVGDEAPAGEVKGAERSRWWCRRLHLVRVSWGLLVDFEKKTHACPSSRHSLPAPPLPPNALNDPSACDLGRLPASLWAQLLPLGQEPRPLSEGPKGRQCPPPAVGPFQTKAITVMAEYRPSARFARPAHSLLTGPLESTCRPLPKMTVLASAPLASASFRPAASFPIKPTRGGASGKTDGLIHIRLRPWAQPTVPLCWGAASRLFSVSSPPPSPQASPHPALAPARGGNSADRDLPQRPAEELPVELRRATNSLFQKASFSFSYERNIPLPCKTWKLSEDKY